MSEFTTEWEKPEKIDAKTEKALSGYPPVVRQLLFNRGIRTKKGAQEFFSISYDRLTDPLDLHDTRGAAVVIEKAIADGKKIVIHGDFDVDGIAASTILWNYLYRERKADALPYIPSRVDEGYGMSEKSLDAVTEIGADLVVTVDCGIRDAALVKKYRNKKGKKKLDFIITDHHQLASDFPEDIPVVHPLHPDKKYKEPYISGALVAWKLVAAMEKLRNADITMEDVPGIDLAAFATVCDMMPLSGENRTVVGLGLEQMNSKPRPGLRAMAEEAGITDSDIEAYHLGYILGPRINAAGRIGDPMDGVRLLATNNPRFARENAIKLGKLNKERQLMTDTLLNEVRAQIEEQGTGKHLYFAYGNDWPEGIIGLVAGKIQEWFHRPVVVVSKGEISSRGSARSISGFDIVRAIGSFEKLLERYGGHEQAAGFTIPTENIEEFKEELVSLAEKSISSDDLVKKLSVDAVVEVGDLDWDLMKEIDRFKPFGYGNRRPLFWISNAQVYDTKAVGDGSHLKLSLKDGDGSMVEGIYFNAGDAAGYIERDMTVDIAGYLDVNSWNGRDMLQVNVKDMKVDQ
jgi:single-stranded-DNA-specific exonuclease